MRKNIIILLVCTMSLTLAHAGNDEESFDDSLLKTQELLKDKTQRTKAVNETENARKADQQVQKLATDPKTQDEYYQLAAEIIGNYKEQKDEEGMKRSISEAQKDPASFYHKLTPAQKEKIKALSEKLNPGAVANP